MTAISERPADWRWSGHDELTGARSRYTVLCLDRMLESLDLSSLDAFQRTYEDGIATSIGQEHLAREAAWTESLAVGDRAFVERVARGIRGRSRFEYDMMSGDKDAWGVREPVTAYGAVS